MESRQVKLFDSDNNLVQNFDDEIEKILVSVHGDKYYDVDEPLVNTNLIPVDKIINKEKEEELEKTMELVDSLVTDDAPKIKIVEEKKTKVGIKDFIPLLFFIVMFVILAFGAYYFLSNFDISSITG